MIVHLETEGVNPITVKMLPYEAKVVYTYIKKNKTVECTELVKHFKKWDVKSIVKDLNDMYLVYFERGNQK